LIKQKPGFSGKIFWTLEIPFKTGFTALTPWSRVLYLFTLLFRFHFCGLFGNILLSSVLHGAESFIYLLYYLDFIFVVYLVIFCYPQSLHATYGIE
jgi:hypothetical protein